MKLNAYETARFYRMFKSLVQYINNLDNLIEDAEDFRTAEFDDPQALDQIFRYGFKDRYLIEAYLSVNPDDFSTEELDIIRKWPEGIDGLFYVERITKNGAVLIDESSEKVYLMAGLASSPEELFSGWKLPLQIRVILIPWRDRIIFSAVYSANPDYPDEETKKSLRKFIWKHAGQIRLLKPFAQNPETVKRNSEMEPAIFLQGAEAWSESRMTGN